MKTWYNYSDCTTAASTSLTYKTNSIYKDWTDCTTAGTSSPGSVFVKYGGYDDCEVVYRDRVPAKLPAAAANIELPDGAKLIVDKDGNYHIDDSNAQVIYKANRMREFSPHLNASDMLSDFVRQAGALGVKKEDVLNLPIHLFISWLVIEAAERDGDPHDVPRLEDSKELVELKHPHCLSCGKFIRQLHYRNGFPFCSPDHASKHLALST